MASIELRVKISNIEGGPLSTEEAQAINGYVASAIRGWAKGGDPKGFDWLVSEGTIKVTQLRRPK